MDVLFFYNVYSHDHNQTDNLFPRNLFFKQNYYKFFYLIKIGIDLLRHMKIISVVLHLTQFQFVGEFNASFTFWEISTLCSHFFFFSATSFIFLSCFLVSFFSKTPFLLDIFFFFLFIFFVYFLKKNFDFEKIKVFLFCFFFCLVMLL